MKQLALEVRLADHAVFANFHPAGNELVLHELRQPMAGARPVRWIWGPAHAGKSHLLQACAAAADEAGERAGYLPLDRTLGLPVAALEGLGGLDVVVLDDMDEVAGDPCWERAVFGLYEQLRESRGRLIVATSKPPGDVPLGLADLASRLKSGGAFRLSPLDDEGRLRALQMRARFRGFELPDDTGRYLLTRVPRGTGDLFRILDELDRAALVAQRRLTIAFVRSVLGS